MTSLEPSTEQLNETFYIGIGQNQETKLYHGMVYQKNYAPSGFERHFVRFSMNVGMATRKEAAEAVNAAFPKLKPYEVTND